MVISFENEGVRNICENEDMALSEYGLAISEKLKIRLSDMEAVDFLSQLEVGNIAKVEGLECNNFKIDLIKDKALLIFSLILQNKTSQENILDRVNRIKILEIRLL